MKKGKKYFIYDLFDFKETDHHIGLARHSDSLYQTVKGRFSVRKHIEVVQGRVPESFGDRAPQTVAFAHIDLIHAEAEVDALRWILPRMTNGGVIVLDDYGWRWQYEQKAIDGFVDPLGLQVTELPTGQGLLMVAGRPL